LYFYYLLVSAGGCRHISTKFGGTATVILREVNNLLVVNLIITSNCSENILKYTAVFTVMDSFSLSLSAALIAAQLDSQLDSQLIDAFNIDINN